MRASSRAVSGVRRMNRSSRNTGSVKFMLGMRLSTRMLFITPLLLTYHILYYTMQRHYRGILLKFKVIFIIFNIVIIAAFFLIFLSPLFVMGLSGFLMLLGQNYIIAVVFCLFLIAFNVFFIKNWRYYSYLENEDWSALVSYLENSVYRRRSGRVGFIRTLLNAYIVTSNMNGISRLQKHFIEKKTAVIERFSLQFAIPYLLSSKPAEGEAVFRSLVNQPGTHHRDWMRWNLAFCLLQQNKIEPAKQELVALLDHQPDFALSLIF